MRRTPREGGDRFDVRGGRVEVGGEGKRLIAVEPNDDDGLSKGSTVVVHCGYVTFEYTSTMNHEGTVYLVYRPDRVMFEIARGLEDDGEVPGLSELPFSVEAVEIRYVGGGSERHELQ